MIKAIVGVCLAVCTLFAGGVQAQGRELKPIRLMYQTTAFGAPILVAIEKGWYEQALNKVGYTLKISTATFGPPVLEAMAAGQIDIGELGASPFVVGFARGLPIKAVLATNISGESIMVHRDSPIRSIKDLAGKKIAINGKGTMMDFIMRRALAANGLKSGDVTWIELSAPDSSTALDRKQIDAAALFEPWTARLQMQGHRMIATGQEIWPNHDNQLITATTAAIRDHEPAVRVFVEQTIRGIEYIMDNPEDAITVTARRLGVERDIIARSWSNMIRRRSGAPNAEGLQDFINALREWNYVKKPVAAKDGIDTRFLKN